MNKQLLMEDIRQVLAAHNVSHIEVKEPGNLFIMQGDALSIGVKADVVEKEGLRAIEGGRK